MATPCSYTSVANTTVIIPAAGRGHRFGVSSTPKQYQLLRGRPILWHTLRRFQETPAVQAIVVAIHPDDATVFSAIAEGFAKVRPAVLGGTERADSVRLALESLPQDAADELVLVHDAVRPWVSLDLVNAVIEATREHGAVVPAMSVTETVKVVREGVVLESPDRSSLYTAQTPQGFRRDILERAIAISGNASSQAVAPATDEACLVERAGMQVHIVPGETANVKITTAADLPEDPTARLRVGTGYDVHAFAPGRPLILGGVHIAADIGLAGHSDADVLTHAVIDSLLGGARMGDIGQLFPDTDPTYAGINSLCLLAQVRERLQGSGIEIINIDAVVMAQAPKLAPHVDAMCASMAAVLEVSSRSISVKATTTEHLGFVGRQEGMAAQATTLLRVPASLDV
jgi:2-C-methyl-D-erythritol 4-phosphate cytidylyltransferase / 2-C-methyl-D-erythritol 2,4-cyclodiphosphate synthase